jgi:hypothetical protein
MMERNEMQAMFINSMGQGLMKHWADIFKMPRKQLEAVFGENMGRSIRKIKQMNSDDLTALMQIFAHTGCNFIFQRIELSFTPSDAETMEGKEDEETVESTEESQ